MEISPSHRLIKIQVRRARMTESELALCAEPLDTLQQKEQNRNITLRAVF
jgi:hypothetical protein